MFQFLLRVKAMHRLGLAKPFGILVLLVLAGALIAGLIYAFTIFNVATERNRAPHVHIYRSN
jgi:hypothetical protein